MSLPEDFGQPSYVTVSQLCFCIVFSFSDALAEFHSHPHCDPVRCALHFLLFDVC